MDPLMIGIIGVVAFLVIMFLGIPIPFAMLFCGATGIAIIKTPAVASQIMTADFLNTFSSYTLTVSPLFGLMGFIASYSGIGSSLFKAVNSFIGHKRGGLAMATQVACAGFGAICGSVPATISTMSAVGYPEMRKRSYAPELAGTCIAAGAALSVLIPPSSNFIIYGTATDTSIGHLFAAGIIPGILLTILNIIAIVYIGKRHPQYAPVSEKENWKQRWESVVRGGIIEIIIVFLISMGGMFAGFFTPTEAGAVGAFGMLLVTIVTKKVNFKKIMNSMYAAVRLQAMVFLLLACANVFGRFVTMSGIPIALGRFVDGLDVPNWAIMAVVLIIYFLMGMVTDLLSMTLVTMPIFYPIVVDMLGFSPVWFGVIISMVIAIGGITPPLGTGIFIMKGCVAYDEEATLARLFSGVWPFVVAAAAATIILTIFPELATWLPDLMYG